MHKIGFLLIHGFGGNSNEVAPLAEFLTRQGYLTVSPQLKGHTGKRKDLQTTSYLDWIKSAEDGLLTLQAECEKIILAGFSMGGLIAFQLSVRYPVTALITMNTPIYFWDLKQVAFNLITDFKTGEYRHLKHYLNSSSNLPLSAMYNFQNLLTNSKPLIPKITCPLLVLQATDDDAVQPKSADYIHEHANSALKSMAFFEHSGHAMLHSPAAASALTRIELFIREVERIHQ